MIHLEVIRQEPQLSGCFSVTREHAELCCGLYSSHGPIKPMSLPGANEKKCPVLKQKDIIENVGPMAQQNTWV